MNSPTILQSSACATAFALVALLPALAHADWTIGSGRSSGMGRAGLAVPYDWVYSGRMNPAIYGLAPTEFRFQIPGLSYRLKGLSYSELRDFAGSVNDGGVDSDKLSSLARTLGDENVEFGAGLASGLFIKGLMVDFEGSAVATTRPNAELQTWVQSGSSGAVPANARLDAYGVGGYETGFAYGRRLNTPGDYDVSVGARFKVVRSYYSHNFVDSASIQTSGGSNLATEMNGNSHLSDTGYGLDFGLVSSSSKTEGLFFGAVIENLIQPKVTFDGTLPGGSPDVSEIRPYSRKFNLGTGYMTPNKFLLAADFYDVFNGGGAQEFRAGTEFKSTSWFAVRGGYASRSGFTMGVGLGDFNLSLGSNMASQFSYSLRF